MCYLLFEGWRTSARSAFDAAYVPDFTDLHIIVARSAERAFVSADCRRRALFVRLSGFVLQRLSGRVHALLWPRPAWLSGGLLRLLRMLCVLAVAAAAEGSHAARVVLVESSPIDDFLSSSSSNAGDHGACSGLLLELRLLMLPQLEAPDTPAPASQTILWAECSDACDKGGGLLRIVRSASLHRVRAVLGPAVAFSSSCFCSCAQFEAQVTSTAASQAIVRVEGSGGGKGAEPSLIARSATLHRGRVFPGPTVAFSTSYVSSCAPIEAPDTPAAANQATVRVEDSGACKGVWGGRGGASSLIDCFASPHRMPVTLGSTGGFSTSRVCSGAQIETPDTPAAASQVIVRAEGPGACKRDCVGGVGRLSSLFDRFASPYWRPVTLGSTVAFSTSCVCSCAQIEPADPSPTAIQAMVRAEGLWACKRAELRFDRPPCVLPHQLWVILGLTVACSSSRVCSYAQIEMLDPPAAASKAMVRMEGSGTESSWIERSASPPHRVRVILGPGAGFSSRCVRTCSQYLVGPSLVDISVFLPGHHGNALAQALLTKMMSDDIAAILLLSIVFPHMYGCPWLIVTVFGAPIDMIRADLAAVVLFYILASPHMYGCSWPMVTVLGASLAMNGMMRDDLATVVLFHIASLHIYGCSWPMVTVLGALIAMTRADLAAVVLFHILASPHMYGCSWPMVTELGSLIAMMRADLAAVVLFHILASPHMYSCSWLMVTVLGTPIAMTRADLAAVGLFHIIASPCMYSCSWLMVTVLGALIAMTRANYTTTMVLFNIIASLRIYGYTGLIVTVLGTPISMMRDDLAAVLYGRSWLMATVLLPERRVDISIKDLQMDLRTYFVQNTPPFFTDVSMSLQGHHADTLGLAKALLAMIRTDIAVGLFHIGSSRMYGCSRLLSAPIAMMRANLGTAVLHHSCIASPHMYGCSRLMVTGWALCATIAMVRADLAAVAFFYIAFPHMHGCFRLMMRVLGAPIAMMRAGITAMALFCIAYGCSKLVMKVVLSKMRGNISIKDLVADMTAFFPFTHAPSPVWAIRSLIVFSILVQGCTAAPINLRNVSESPAHVIALLINQGPDRTPAPQGAMMLILITSNAAFIIVIVVLVVLTFRHRPHPTPPPSPPSSPHPTFRCGQSAVGAQEAGNRGLFVGEDAVQEGEILPVEISHLICFPRGPREQCRHWRDRCEGELALTVEMGYYNFLLWNATDLHPDELAVFWSEGAEGPTMMTRTQIEGQGVILKPHAEVTYALVHPEASLFNLANDGAYDSRCTREEYEVRAANVNHAVFEAGIGPEGYQDQLYVRFTRDALPDTEVFITYGWGFWEDFRASPVGRKRVSGRMRRPALLRSVLPAPVGVHTNATPRQRASIAGGGVHPRYVDLPALRRPPCKSIGTGVAALQSLTPSRRAHVATGPQGCWGQVAARPTSQHVWAQSPTRRRSPSGSSRDGGVSAS